MVMLSGLTYLVTFFLNLILLILLSLYKIPEGGIWPIGSKDIM